MRHAMAFVRLRIGEGFCISSKSSQGGGWIEEELTIVSNLNTRAGLYQSSEHGVVAPPTRGVND